MPTLHLTDAELTEIKHAIEVHNDMHTDRFKDGDYEDAGTAIVQLSNIHMALFKVGGSLNSISGYSQ